jgi:hypothetical protein
MYNYIIKFKYLIVICLGQSQLLQLLLRKFATIEQRINSIADAVGNILTIIGGAGTGDVDLPEGVELPITTIDDLTQINNLIKDSKEAKKKLVQLKFYFI